MLISWSWTTYPLECPLRCLAARFFLAPLPVSLPLSSLGFLLGLLGLCPPARFALPLVGPAFGLLLLVAGYRAGGYSGGIDTRARGARTARANGGGHVEVPRAQSLCGFLVTIPSRRTRFGM